MNEQEKREQLKRVPTRTLLASIKKDIRKTLKAAKATSKPMKK